jgi:hypothetical protein
MRSASAIEREGSSSRRIAQPADRLKETKMPENDLPRSAAPAT